MGTSEETQREMLAEARAEVAIADTKASILLAALGIGFGAVLGGLLAGDWEPTVLVGAARFFWWIGATFALSSVAAAASSIWPRYPDRSHTSELNYWGHVARHTNVRALRSALEDNAATPAQRIEHQLWFVSRVVQKKYRLVRIALLLAGGASLIFVLVGISYL